MKGERLEKLNGEQAIVDDVIAKRHFLYSLADKMREIHQEIYRFSRQLEEKYPDAREYYLFHILAGSSKDRKACTGFDFPGDDSIVRLVDNLYDRYKA